MFEASNDVLRRFDQYIMRWKLAFLYSTTLLFDEWKGQDYLCDDKLATRLSQEVLSGCTKSSVRFEYGVTGRCCSYCFSHLRLPVLWHKSALRNGSLVIALVQWQRLCEACLANVGECNILCTRLIRGQWHRQLVVMLRTTWHQNLSFAVSHDKCLLSRASSWHDEDGVSFVAAHCWTGCVHAKTIT